MDQHQLKDFIRENCFRELFNPEDINFCQYFDEEEFINCKRNESYYLNILPMNIRQGGDWYVYVCWKSWKLSLISLY